MTRRLHCIAKKNRPFRSPMEVHDLTQRLREIRRESLDATRRGDYMRVARLTAQAIEVNRAIMEAQGLLRVMA